MDVTSVTNREAIELAKLGFATPYLWRRAMGAYREPDEEYAPDYLAWTGLVWMALRRAGIHVDLATLEFDFDSLLTRKDPGETDEPGDAEPGKAPDESSNEPDGTSSNEHAT